MHKKDKILDDVARLAGGTIGVASGISHNIRAEIKARVDEIVDRLDLVPRQDFDRLEAMLQETRSQNEELKTRLDKLEKKKVK